MDSGPCHRLCLALVVFTTFFCGGDLSSDGVDLEQEDAVFVGDLADQVVAQSSIERLGVVFVQSKHSGKRDAWRPSRWLRRQNRTTARCHTLNMQIHSEAKG